MFKVLVVSLLVALAGCPPAAGPRGGAGRGGAALNADACGTINTNPVGRKLYSFLVASAELDRASFELENSVAESCRKMGSILGASTVGDTRAVCTEAANALKANLQISVKTESRLVTKYTPPVCQTKLDLAAGFVAECEASASAEVNVTCSGTCSGTCNGACNGTCSAMGANGQCAGQCSGTCSGRCTGGCDGSADVQASAECKASAEIRANVRTECSEPKVEVVRENVTVVDDSKFQLAIQAINAGIPKLAVASKKLEIAGKALVTWVQTGASLLRSAGDLAGQLGEKGICVGTQLAAVVAASANIQARFSVSIEMSASVSASAGAQAQ
ncbi:MAG TPA: hypothetical protein VM513_00170 [Kofleriaceae bacterium]|jgi:hypothetical protein|nr:hypothetical protein [Kofleriaceae bacterium]